MSTSAFIAEIWDAEVMRTLEDNLVARKICRNYSNKVKDVGDVIHFNGLSDPTVSSYTGTVTYETPVSGTNSLSVDQFNYYGFDIKDIDEAMQSIDTENSQAARAGYKLRQACDTYLMSLYSGADSSNVVTDATCDTATIISDIGLLWQYLNQNNVPDGQMWLTIPGWVKLKLMEAGIKFSINEGINGKGGISWAKSELGFDIYVTNQVYNSGTFTAPVSYCMAGSYNAIGFAEAAVKSEVLRAETAFANHVRGYQIFGAKVLKPKELAYATLTYTAETAI
jgi:hypothetical protein